MLKALTRFGKLGREIPRPGGLRIDAPPVDGMLSMSSESAYGNLRRLWASGRAMALHAPMMLVREKKNTRTGGPDDDEDDELRRLMPILAAVITIAVVFGQ